MTPLTVTCPACGHSWSVDLDTYTPVREIYRGEADTRRKVEEYRFKCEACGEYFIEEVELEESTEGGS